MKENIFIPKLCKVGFNTRTDTYTGKLAYVIYNDGKKWRKEDSWNSWRENYISPEDFEKKRQEEFVKNIKHVEEIFQQYQTGGFYKNLGWAKDIVSKGLDEFKKKERVDSLESFSTKFRLPNFSKDQSIIPFEFKNEAREGFVLNKKAGGHSSGWNHRQTYCRVYDPLGFEFEIGIENLLYILEHSSSIAGKGLVGKFIYGWSGKDLVLVPENAPEYQEMLNFTKIQSDKVFKKDLVEGYQYLLKNKQIVTYMGERNTNDYKGVLTGKKLWFARGKSFTTLSIGTLAGKLEIDPAYPELSVEFLKQQRIQTPVEMEKHTVESINSLIKKDSYKTYVTVYVKTKEGYSDKMLIEEGRYHGRTFSGQPSITFNKEFFHSQNTIQDLLNKYELWKIK